MSSEHQAFIARIPEFAEIQVELCQQGFGVTLDFSAQSFQMIDQIVESLGDYAHWPPERVQQAAVTFGSYVGETIRRLLGGHWEFEGSGYCLTHVGNAGVVVYPFGKIQKRFANGMVDSILHYYEGISKITTA